jgi:hypothetical protein
MITFYPDGSKTDSRSLSEAKTERISGIASECSDALYGAGIDNITQQNASLGIYSVERQNQIRHYIARCRDEYVRCKQLVESASTNDAVDAVIFIAPAVEFQHFFTAEQIVSQYFSAYQIAALQRLEMALLAAKKPLGPQMTAAKQWLEGVMLGWAMNPVAAPAAAFGEPSVTFEQASAEAVAGLQN